MEMCWDGFRVGKPVGFNSVIVIINRLVLESQNWKGFFNE